MFRYLTPAILFPLSLAASPFSWHDSEGKHLDLHFQDRPLIRYVYEAIDRSSEERRVETYKPFVHVFDAADTGEFLTKGPGGKFTHHRGIYYGFSRCSYVDSDGEKHSGIDTWHCKELAAQIHREFTAQETTEDGASFTAQIGWIDSKGNIFAKETRTHHFSTDGDQLIVDFESSLVPTGQSLKLDGDPQHAGFQFRAHNDVHDHTKDQTYYIRPASGVGKPGQTINWSKDNDTEATRDVPWKAMSFVLRDRRHTVAYLDHPRNPKPARYSERDYGRFGSYFVAEATPESPVAVKYRLVIAPDEATEASISDLHETFLKSNP
ncbi:MAG: DUF6807 family protein [Verrucomicrobiota bacterium]